VVTTSYVLIPRAPIARAYTAYYVRVDLQVLEKSDERRHNTKQRGEASWEPVSQLQNKVERKTNITNIFANHNIK
jgi:hypothetical protein